MAHEIIEKLKKEIEGSKIREEFEEVGSVLEVGDGIARISGLESAMSQEILNIETAEGEVSAVALNLEESSVGVLLLEGAEQVKSGDIVKTTGEILSLEAGRGLLGRIVNPLGGVVDGKGAIFSSGEEKRKVPLEKKAYSVLDREPVRTPLHTGIKSIDSMIPIGRGQRELIIGDRQTGKTAIALDSIINQGRDKTSKRPICVYVAVGQRESKVAQFAETLKQHGALDHTVIVSASASSPAAMWYLAPYAGAAIGEYFMENGEDALVIYDDLSKHAWAYRQISLLLRRPPGREAYPGDVFYLHSRLLERAAKLSKEKGGGSMTALPIIETQLGDVTAYIPTNVISITDGQIYLESDLFNKGMRPAVNIGLSVSRVGSSAQTKAMKKVAGKLRLALAQFRELRAFTQFSSDVDEATKTKIRHGEALEEILKQEDIAPMTFEKEVLVFYAAINHYFDHIPVEDIKEKENKFIEFVENLHPEILDDIRKSMDLTDKNEENLKKISEEFFAK